MFQVFFSDQGTDLTIANMTRLMHVIYPPTADELDDLPPPEVIDDWPEWAGPPPEVEVDEEAALRASIVSDFTLAIDDAYVSDDGRYGARPGADGGSLSSAGELEVDAMRAP